MASVRYMGMMEGVRKQTNSNILFFSQIDMRHMRCILPSDKRLRCKQAIIAVSAAQVWKNNIDAIFDEAALSVTGVVKKDEKTKKNVHGINNNLPLA